MKSENSEKVIRSSAKGRSMSAHKCQDMCEIEILCEFPEICAFGRPQGGTTYF